MNLVEEGFISEKKDGVYIPRRATALEIIGTICLKQMLIVPDKNVEHFDEITLISHYAKKGQYSEAEKIIQQLLKEESDENKRD